MKPSGNSTISELDRNLVKAIKEVERCERIWKEAAQCGEMEPQRWRDYVEAERKRRSCLRLRWLWQ